MAIPHDDLNNNCPRCFIGRLSPTMTNYVLMVDGYMVSIPDLQVQTCDVCDYTEYDAEHDWVHELLALDSDLTEDMRNGVKRALRKPHEPRQTKS